MYWDMAQAFLSGSISIPNNEDLINELGAITMDMASGNKLRVCDKKEIRKRLGFSPDRADATAMTFYKSDMLFRKSNNKAVLPKTKPVMPSPMCA